MADESDHQSSSPDKATAPFPVFLCLLCFSLLWPFHLITVIMKVLKRTLMALGFFEPKPKLLIKSLLHWFSHMFLYLYDHWQVKWWSSNCICCREWVVKHMLSFPCKTVVYENLGPVSQSFFFPAKYNIDLNVHSSFNPQLVVLFVCISLYRFGSPPPPPHSPLQSLCLHCWQTPKQGWVKSFFHFPSLSCWHTKENLSFLSPILPLSRACTIYFSL